MRGQRGWRELAALGDKINRFTGMMEGLIWSPRGAGSNGKNDDWAFEDVCVRSNGISFARFLYLPFALNVISHYKFLLHSAKTNRK